MKKLNLFLLVLFFFPLVQGQKRTITVAPSGRELSTASLLVALDKVAGWKEKGEVNGPVYIELEGGVYYIDHPVVLTVHNGGSANYPVIIRPVPGQHVVFDGSTSITGWKKYKGNTWMASVPAVKDGKWDFRQLWVNGKACTLARTPDKGFYIVSGFPEGGEEVDYHKECRRFQYREGDINPAWKNLADVRVIVYHFWSDAHLQIESVDASTRTVTFRYPASKRFTDDFTSDGARYIVENVFEGLDEPGEFYTDRKAGIVYYIPREGEDMKTASVLAPVTPAFFTITGGSHEQPVENILIESIDFRYSNFMLPEGDQNDYQGSATIPAVVTFRYAKDITVEGCSFSELGNFAFDVQRGCSGILINHNRMENLAAGAVKINGGTAQDHPMERTGNIVVSDNEIGPYGLTYPSAVGILLMHAQGCTLAHNHIHDGWYTGISLGWNWGYDRSISRDNIVEFNHIHDIGKGLLSDMGGIYTLGLSPGTVLRYNLIHDVDANRYGGWGIYNDEGSSHMLIENNIVYNTKYAAYNIHYAKELTVRNNIFALGKLEVLSRGRMEPHTSVYFENNIVYWNSLKDPFSVNWKDQDYIFYAGPMNREEQLHSTFDSDYNLFWYPGAGRDELTFNGNSWADWLKAGKDLHSVYADPMFRDPEKFDFTLLPGSPAFQLGFKQIDMSTVGVRKEKEKE
ncbi:MAG: right-handed parallel beta-helix repeat-containing protein [Bacteroidales bacterium]